MYKLLKRLTIKTILLMLVTIVPVLIYTYTEDDGQYIFNINRKEDINRYIIEAELMPESKTLELKEYVYFKNTTGKTIDKIYFHIYPNTFKKEATVPFYEDEFKLAYPNGFQPGYIDIKEVKINRERGSYKVIGQGETILAINLPKPIAHGQNIKIYINGTISIPNSIGRFGYHKNTYNITNWYPILAVYDNQGWNLDPYYKIGDPFYSDISDYYVEFVVPEGYTPVSSGRIIKKENDGDKAHFHIQASNVRDFAVIVSDSFKRKERVVDNIKVSSYYFNDKYEEEALSFGADAIRVFNSLFGRYPYEEFNVVAADYYVGGMEYPNLVMIDNGIYGYSSPDILEYIIVHEAAHQWWYGIVGNNQIDQPWLDESLTEYSTILYYEYKYGKEIADQVFQKMIKKHYDNSITQGVNEEFIDMGIKDYESEERYTAMVYHKGAIVLKEFREDIGDERFFEILRRYYKRYMFDNGTTDGFIDICEEVLAGKEIHVKKYLTNISE